MTDYKLSVIIPVFNAAQHIERCCRSLFGQTLDNIQYIFVNDGSNDNSIELICREADMFPERKDSIIIIDRHENKGVAFTRQQGLEFAQGEYIIHCDADDWVEPNMYELLYQTGKKENADVVCCGYMIENGNNKRAVLPQIPYNVDFKISPIFGSLCSRASRKTIFDLNGIKFSPDINWGEDFLVSAKCQVLANKVAVVNKPLYHYIQHSTSITHTITHEKCLNLLKCGVEMEKFLREKGLFEKYEFELNFLKFQLKQFFLIFPEVYSPSLWKQNFVECHKDILHYNTSFYLKISAWLVAHHLTPLARIILQLRILLNRIRH